MNFLRFIAQSINTLSRTACGFVGNGRRCAAAPAAQRIIYNTPWYRCYEKKERKKRDLDERWGPSPTLRGRQPLRQSGSDLYLPLLPLHSILLRSSYFLSRYLLHLYTHMNIHIYVYVFTYICTILSYIVYAFFYGIFQVVSVRPTDERASGLIDFRQ